MLTLRSVEIKNFVCFDSLIIEPSADANRSLTVIRAENGSGKTTLLRAIRWGMYGNRALPGENKSQFSLHPAWWKPTDPDVETGVSIEFETDGSSRYHRGEDTEGAMPQLYRINRTVRTIGQPGVKDGQPDFQRVNENITLMVRDVSGKWDQHDAHPDSVIDELLPWELRDFFIMDADEAADFVGGSENKLVSRNEYREKTTYVIKGLLGLEAFEKARYRVVEKIAPRFARKATKAIGDHDLTQLQQELDQARFRKQKNENEIQDLKGRKADLDDKLEQLQADLEEELGRKGAYDSLIEQLGKNTKEYERATSERDNHIADLSGDLESPHLFAQLAFKVNSDVHNDLQPLYDQGQIPLTHLPFVRGLLQDGRCVCGQDLTVDNEQRQRVTQRVNDADEQASRANHLYYIYEATLSLRDLDNGSAWNDMRVRHAASLAECDNSISVLKTEKQSLDSKLSDIDEGKIQTLRSEIVAHEKQMDTTKSDLALKENKIQRLGKQIESFAKKIAQRQRKEREAADYRAAEEMASHVIDVIDSAYSTIEQEQVRSLSEQMNRLFYQMAANVSDADFTETQRRKTNLRMISKVGVKLVGQSGTQPIQDKNRKFEIYALNGRGRAMPPVEINGASRRVLALSFVLALCDESDTHAPLIADSLLNFLSGSVRHNTLRVTSEYSGQPILLLTGSDLEAPSEISVVEQHAGATFTLTGQWDAIDAGHGGDVVKQTQKKKVSLLCPCDPRQYCDICERVGQASAPGWTRRLN